MQHEQVARFFIGLIVLMILIMGLSAIAIPEVVSMIDASCHEPSETGLLNTCQQGVANVILL
jgi:hypothetical protein